MFDTQRRLTAGVLALILASNVSDTELRQPDWAVELAPNVPGPKAGEEELVCQVCVCVWITR